MPVGRAPRSPASTPDDLARGRRRDDPREHLPPAAAARAGAVPPHSAASTGSWAGTGAGAHRLRRLPDLLAPGPTARITEEGARFRATSTSGMHLLSPGAVDRGPDRDRLGHHDGARRVHPVDRRAGGDPRARWSARTAGRCAASPRARTRRRRSSRSCRAASSRSWREESARVPHRSTRSTASRSAASRWATRAPSART